MNKNQIFFDPYLAEKFGLKTSIVLNQVKLILQLNKKIPNYTDKFPINFSEISKVLFFMKKIQITGCIKKCYKISSEKEILKYLNCNHKELQKILNLISKGI